MSTIHNPTNFDPSAYEIVGYFDNQPPKLYPGMDTESFDRLHAAWESKRLALFPDGNCHRCQHCGNGSVRYVVAAVHRPTGDRICFGDICVNRLSIPNRDEFKMKCIRDKASAAARAEKLAAMRQNFLDTHPDLAAAISSIDRPEHADNSFVRDVLSKLSQYGSLSDRQVDAVISSLSRDVEWARKKAEEKASETVPTVPAPIGRIEVTGRVVCVKSQATAFGLSLKMLLVLKDGNKAWCSVPSNLSTDGLKDSVITLVATWSRSASDDHFSFGSRPRYIGAEVQ